MDRETKGQFFFINFIPVVNGMIKLVRKCTSTFINIQVGHLFPAVRGQVEDEDCEEGDAHAGDDQVYLVVVVMITKGKVIMIIKEKLMMISDHHHHH